jgi:hypothetical protein
MKAKIFAVLLACSQITLAQTKLEKRFPITKDQRLSMYFDFPESVTISTWTEKDILVRGTVSINGGEHDNLFQVNTLSSSKDVVKIESQLPDPESIPKRTVIKLGEEEYVFKEGDPAIKKFIEEHNGTHTYISNGVQIRVSLEIFVPEGTRCDLESKFGMVEVKSYRGPLSVNAPHGGIDATISPESTGVLSASTSFGEIYSNLKFDQEKVREEEHGHGTSFSTRLGNGADLALESKFGKIYLRSVKQ